MNDKLLQLRKANEEADVKEQRAWAAYAAAVTESRKAREEYVELLIAQ